MMFHHGTGYNQAKSEEYVKEGSFESREPRRVEQGSVYDLSQVRCEVVGVSDGAEKELVGNSPEQRNWRGIGIALLVILIVCALIVTAVILVTPKNEDEKVGINLQYSDLFDAKLQPKTFYAQWITDDTYVHRDDDGALVQVNVGTNTSHILMDNATFRRLNTEQFQVSDDLDYVLIGFDKQSINRYTHLTFYKIYNVTTGKITPVPGDEIGDPVALQHASWVPKSNKLLYIRDNDIYYHRDPYTTPNRITTTGVKGTVYNGIPDWLYEEEILDSGKAFWWSPQGTYLCYAMFDDTQVPLYEFPEYGGSNQINSENRKVRYPKAGDLRPNINPKVTLKIAKFKGNGQVHVELSPPPELTKEEYYFTSVSWASETEVIVIWMNRAQNLAIVSFCSPITGACEPRLRERETDGWVNLYKAPILQPNGKNYFLILPLNEGELGAFNHIAKIERKPVVGSSVHKAFITQGNFDDTEILKYDGKKEVLYYITTAGDPRKRRLYTVAANQYQPTPKCLSCIPGCDYASATFSPDSQYYFLNCHGPDVPTYYLRSTNSDLDVIVENNTLIKKTLDNMALPIKEYHQIDIGGGYKAWLQLNLPPLLKKEHVTQYPVLVSVYGGPGSQKVNDKFKLDWFSYLSSAHDVIHATLDGRGTGYRGTKYLRELWRKFGGPDVEDQLLVAKYLKTLHFVDQSKIGIMGWSYGGFVAGHAIGRGEGEYQCGIAVAPVTDFRYYDTAYTERYMGTPRGVDNFQGYERAKMMNHAKGFKSSKFLLVHGTADDNVHFQNSAQLMKSLVHEGISFDSQIYPDQNHNLNGGRTLTHLYQRMTHFLVDCYNTTKPVKVPPKDIPDERVARYLALSKL
ncbi:inactive dipeptidyl peptidase 10-like isoform X2 [Tubulanus polymorphus]|uniref:inactive dipeptidyl peptidase 10-like isoform X2 n=1 Tax=Tubulanus polymorphus TaxID=672921 RepID=UPI003DA4CEEE